ncbi:hypothetical protein EDB80DRAFT_729426 [Ilyonectria destructans]|nr:hypothetical protein EDB80DRAFT_729426 [Ilyonectria destructans]
MLRICTAELTSIETRLTQFSTKQNGGRSSHVYGVILCYVKNEELEDARNRVRDKTTQANLFLGLLQAQAIRTRRRGLIPRHRQRRGFWNKFSARLEDSISD